MLIRYSFPTAQLQNPRLHLQPPIPTSTLPSSHFLFGARFQNSIRFRSKFDFYSSKNLYKKYFSFSLCFTCSYNFFSSKNCGFSLFKQPKIQNLLFHFFYFARNSSSPKFFSSNSNFFLAVVFILNYSFNHLLNSVSMANEINSFLQKSLESVNSKDVKKYHFVMGNEASDMDSIISSISYAFFRQSQVKNEKEEAYVPVMNIPRKDFALRTETDYIFQKLGINKQNLLFYPEIQSLLDNSKGNVHFILVDHNRLASYQEKYGMLVEEIIDHHKDEKLYTNLNRTIEMVGSCATLVAEKLFENKSPLISNHAMCTLLLGVILLDTVNLDPKYKKVTPKDIDYAKKLSKALQFDDNKQKTLFEELQGKRFDVSSLSTYDLLRADYKQWKMNQVVVGISSCKRSFAEWFEKDPDITRDAERICTNFKLDILFIMTQFMDSKNEMRRELGIFTKKKDLHDNVVTFLMTTDLKLEAIETQKSQTLSQNEKIITFYTQKNVGLSRKQLQPFLDSFYSKK